MDDVFDVEDFEQIVKMAINETLKDNKSWDSSKVVGWSNTICNQILKGSLGMNKRFKFMITCNLMQKSGAGMCTSRLGLYVAEVAESAVPARSLRWLPELTGTSSMLYAFHGAGMRKTELLAGRICAG